MTAMNENIKLMMPIKAAPYDHQKKAFAFACDKFGVFDERLKSRGTALLMEMGTGKTIVSIAVAGCMYQYGKVNRVLVVAPISILGVWEEEFEKFADFPYSMTILKGTAAKKKEQLSKLPDGGLQVVVVNYESAWRLEKELLAYNADLVIADEAHKLKENRTSQSKGMHHIGDKARYKLLLTGTVITNRELDVFSQYRFLNPQIFGTSFYAFRNQYFDMGGYGNHTPIFRKWMTDDFLKRLHSVAYRVTKAECLDLPAITEEVRTVDLEKDAIKLELAKRTKGGSRYSGVSIFSNKIKCADCGGWYGSKVWHSTDRYRKVIYRCNRKYNGEKCQTPHVTEDEVKAAFVSAYNQLVTEKKEITANAEIIRKTLCVTDVLQEEKGKLEEEMAVLVEMTQNIVAENARVAQDQDEYQKRYDGLVQRYDTAKARYDEVVAAISAKEAQSERLADFIKVLKAQDGAIGEFDGSLWGSMVEFVTVGRNKEITFTFRDNTEIQA